MQRRRNMFDTGGANWNYKIYKLSKINALNYGTELYIFADVQEHSKKFKSEARALT